MPVYSMKNIETDEVFEVTMSNAAREAYLIENPQIKQVFLKFPGYVDPVTVGVKRIDDNFRDVLKKAQSAHYGSTINIR